MSNGEKFCVLRALVMTSGFVKTSEDELLNFITDLENKLTLKEYAESEDLEE